MGESYNAAFKNSKIENGKHIQNLAIIREALWGGENLDDCVIIDKATSEGDRIEKFCKVSNTFILYFISWRNNNYARSNYFNSA